MAFSTVYANYSRIGIGILAVITSPSAAAFASWDPDSVFICAVGIDQ